jgi:ferrous iron transport protein B
MYLVSDFIGLQIPVLVVVTMVDVLRSRGKDVDFSKLETILGVPVIPVVTTCCHRCGKVAARLEQLINERPLLASKTLLRAYGETLKKNLWDRSQSTITELIAQEGGKILGKKTFVEKHRDWFALKLMENDEWLRKAAACSCVYDNGDDTEIALQIAGCRHRWIRDCLQKISVRLPVVRSLNPFDRIALHPFCGIALSILFLFSGFALSIFMAEACQHFFHRLIIMLARGAEGLGLSPPIGAFIHGAIFPALLITIYLLIFVAGLTLTIGVMEDVGYMARIAYLFDGLMERIGLHGKCIMPFIAGFGCTIAGVCGARIIDCRCQRRLAIATCWIIPCAGTWGTVGFIAMLFFGKNAVWVILGLFLLAALHMVLTAFIFRHRKGEKFSGMVMELPPYHRPHWQNICQTTGRRLAQLLAKSTPIIFTTAALLWLLLRHVAAGESSTVGTHLIKLSAFFGLHWKLFIALLLSLINRESALGGIAILFYGMDGDLLPLGTGELTQSAHWEAFQQTFIRSVSIPQALAFLTAFFLNAPCCAAIAATAQEVQSYAWTFKLFAYYIFLALFASAVVFHVASWIC